jgi:capsular polysaccharide biosynthesis protein
VKGFRLSEQLFDTRGVIRFLRANRRRLLSLTLLGAAVAVAAMVLRPPLYTATSLVLIPASSSNATAAAGSSGNGATTDIAIATSSSVLAPAITKVHPPLTLDEAEKRVTAVSNASNIVRINAAGTTRNQAEALANAVARQLVAFVTSSGGGAGATELAGPEAQATRLRKQIADLNRQVLPIKAALAAPGLSASAGLQDTQMLATLTTSISNSTLDLENVNNEIASANLDAGITNVGTEVIQQATNASPPSVMDRVSVTIIGAIVGFIVGLLLTFLRRRDPRLTTRDEIAEAVGVPVILSSVVGRWRATSDWLEMLQHHQPGTVERWNVQKAIRILGLAGEEHSRLSVISLAGDAASIVATCHVAIASAASGTRTSLLVTSDDESSTRLSNAGSILSARSEVARPNLIVEPQREGADDEQAALTIVSVVVDPEHPELGMDVAYGAVALAICSRTATAQQIADVLIFLGQKGLSVKGVFVTNPPSDDETVGRPLQSMQADEVVRLRTMRA